MDKQAIEKRIKELEAEPRALVGSDEGTHSKPLNHRLYEEITGERYAVASFSGSNGTRCTEQSAYEDTEGRVIVFHKETSRIRGLQLELIQLRKKLANVR